MNRRRGGISILLDAFEYMFASGCLLAMNFVLMALFGVLRNLPTIMKAAREAVRELLILTYRAYRPLICRLQPIAYQNLGIELGRTALRVVATSIFSLVLLLAFDLVVGWRISILLSVLAIVHGATVGLLWDELDQPNGFRTGERIQ